MKTREVFLGVIVILMGGYIMLFPSPPQATSPQQAVEKAMSAGQREEARAALISRFNDVGLPVPNGLVLADLLRDGDPPANPKDNINPGPSHPPAAATNPPQVLTEDGAKKGAVAVVDVGAPGMRPEKGKWKISDCEPNNNRETFDLTAPYDGIKDKNNPKCYVPRFLPYNRCAPMYFSLGPFKGGTTSIYKYISYHPDVSVHPGPTRAVPRVVRIKEPCWFDVDHLGLDRVPGPTSRDFDGILKKMEGYMDYFPVIRPTDGYVTGEASPNYIFNPGAARRMWLVVPEGRLFIMARDPVFRAYSHVNHFMQIVNPTPLNNAEVSALVDVLTIEQVGSVQKCMDAFKDSPYKTIYNCWQKDVGTNAGNTAPIPAVLQKKASQIGRARRFHFIERGLYLYQLKAFLEYFPKESVAVINSDALFFDEAKVMEEVAAHIGLRPIDWTPHVTKKYNVKADPNMPHGNAGMIPEAAENTVHPISARTRYTLAKFFDPFNTEFEKFIGREMWDYPLDEWRREAEAELALLGLPPLAN